MKSPSLAALCGLLIATSGFAQTATLTTDNATLAPAGGDVVLTATASYPETPGALGWAIELPADWSLVSVTGVNVPAITPAPGSTGTLEFAYTEVPAHRAEFSVVVRYPAGTSAATAKPTVLVRGNGKLSTLTPPAVSLRAPGAGANNRSRD